MTTATLIATPEDNDPVHRPAHYRMYPGVEVIDLTKHMNYCLGNVVKYVARADFKGKPLEDLEKARNYLNIEIERRKEIAELDLAFGISPLIR